MNWPQHPHDPNAPPAGGGYGGPGWPPAGGGPSFGPPGIPSPGPGPTGGLGGLAIGAIITAVLGFLLFVAGLFPCLGWLNWVGIPTNAVALGLGIAGLTTRSAPGPSDASGSIPFVAAIVCGCVGLIGGVIRCILGGGVL